MTDAKDIEESLISDGYDVSGVVFWPDRSEFYAVGFSASDLPDSTLGAVPVDDPSL
jgi:hypothetical protein